MNKLSFEGLKVDLELRKKLTSLLQLKDELEKNSGLNPIEEEQNKLAIQKVDDLIGRIRYSATDKLGVLGKEENKIEKDFPGMAEGEQAHVGYPDLLVGKQPKIGDRQKPIEVSKAAFSPDAPKTSVEQSESDQNYDKANIGGEHLGKELQLSTDGNRPLSQNENDVDLRSGVSKDNKDEQKLSSEEIKLLEEINKYIMKLDKD